MSPGNHNHPHEERTLNDTVETELTLGHKSANKIKNIVLEEDFYALTWISLKWNIWENKKIRNIPIFLGPADFFWIHMNFIIFLVFLIITILLILFEIIEDKGYSAAHLSIVILRVTLVCFAQKSLTPEFYQGLFLLRYSTRHSHQFSHYQFAVFVGACQFLVASTVFISIMLFVCTSDEALDLVIEFAGLSIIAKLDNWIGEAIMLSKLTKGEEIEEDEENHHQNHENHKAHEKHDHHKGRKKTLTEKDSNDDYDLKDLNIKMTLSQKMALIHDEDLILIDDQNEIINAHWIIRSIEYVVHFCQWQYVLPFLTLLFNYVMPLIRPAMEGHHEE